MKKREDKKLRGVFEKAPGSGVWWVQYFDANGRRRREKVGPKSAAKQLVESRRTDARLKRKIPENFRERPATFADIATAALEYSKNHKPRSYRSDKGRMAPLVRRFGGLIAETILPKEFDQWLSTQKIEREWTPATRNRYVALLKLAYKLAEQNGKVKVNPARLLRMPKEDNLRIRYLNQFEPLKTAIDYLKSCKTEEERLRAVISAEYREHLPEFELALHTGMRKSEQYGLEWTDINLGAEPSLWVKPGKNGKGRSIPLNAIAFAVLDFLRSRTGEQNRVFLSGRTFQPLKGNRHWFEHAVKRASIRPFRWHDARHTFASNLAIAGVDLQRIQKLMGHETITVTMRYAHLSQKALASAVAMLAPAETATASATHTKASEPHAVQIRQ